MHLLRLKRQAKNYLRLAMRRNHTLMFYQGLALAWPTTHPILLRFCSLIGKDILDKDQPEKPLLESSLLRISKAFGQVPGQPYHSSIRSATRTSFATFCRTLLAEAVKVKDYSVVPKLPPFAKHSTGEDVNTLIWTWWHRDYMVFSYPLQFGADIEPALAPRLPDTNPEKPSRVVRPLPPERLSQSERIAAEFDLPVWAAKHLIPRLLDDEDINMLAGVLWEEPTAAPQFI